MKSIGGCLLLLAWLFVVFNAYVPGVFRHVSALLLWLAACILFFQANKASQKQITILSVVTLALIGLVYGLGGTVEWVRFFEINETMCAMFAAGSFLSLITHKAEHRQNLTGAKGIFSTYCAANILGGVINLASIYVIGDRLSQKGKLSQEQVELISRGFCAAAYWSPFFVGCAVALSLSHGMKLSVTIPCGILLSLITMLVSYGEIRASYRKKSLEAAKTGNIGPSMADFEGYSLSFKELRLPLALVLGVLLFHLLDPSRSILIVISIVVPTVVFIAMEKQNYRTKIHDQIHDNFPSMGGQIALYLVAGAMSTAILALLKVKHIDFLTGLISSFGPLEAFGVLILIVAISYCGLHPIITIYSLIPLLLNFNPDPTLVGLLIVVGWGLGITVSPLSAANLSFLGRYHTSGKMILKMNKLFVLKILLACLGIFWLETWLKSWLNF